VARKSTKTVAVDSVRHKDKRKNIPTEELRSFVAADEAQPQTLLYPRDPSLDPQLVWKGKDEQDRQDLAVPAVPIYIQEKIHPQALVEDLRAHARKDQPEPQINLFADFNGLDDDFQKKVDFYQHEQHWANRMILGDSLLVMTSLAEKEGLKGKVQMIYVDPPYGIKFGSNWQVSVRSVLDEVFGSENFCAIITARKTGGADEQAHCRSGRLRSLVLLGFRASKVPSTSPNQTTRRWGGQWRPLRSGRTPRWYSAPALQR
jgi:hypothetical protein